MMERIHESAVETAKKVRVELKKYFPNTKFSVTSKTYSMGCSVHVSWTDGPMQEDVEIITDMFESCTSDGMDDSVTCHGYLYEGKLYRGADYVSCSRHTTPEHDEAVLQAAIKLFGEAPERYSNGYYRRMKEAERTINPMPESIALQRVNESVNETVIETVSQTVCESNMLTLTPKEHKEIHQNPFNLATDPVSFINDLMQTYFGIESGPISGEPVLAPVVSLDEYRRRKEN